MTIPGTRPALIRPRTRGRPRKGRDHALSVMVTGAQMNLLLSMTDHTGIPQVDLLQEFFRLACKKIVKSHKIKKSELSEDVIYFAEKVIAEG